MKKITPGGKQLSKNKPNHDLKTWKKPLLIQLDIKQTLTGESGCPPGYTGDNCDVPL